MLLTNLRGITPPAVLLLLLLSITYFFISFLGDPTKQDINKNGDFSIRSTYLITDRSETLEQILTRKSLFVPSLVKDLPWSFDPQAYWLHLTVRNNSNKPAELISHFDNSMLDELDIYQLKKTDVVLKHLRLGDQQEISAVQRFNPHFAFNTAADSESHLYIRIATTGISNTPIQIYERVSFDRLVEKTHLLWGVFIGVLVIIGLYNLVLYFTVKDSVYLTYIAYILSSLALMGVVSGGGAYIFPDRIQMFFSLQVVAINCLVVIFVILFLVQFLKINIEKSWHYNLAVTMIGAAALLFFVSLWVPEYIAARIFFVFLPCVYVICVVLLFNKIRSGLKWGRLYIYSWFPLLACGAIQPMVLLGLIEYSFMTRNAFMIGVLVEIVLMAMALADRMRYQREETLFNATHELSSGLPNLSLFESNINYCLSAREKFTICLIDIDNYHSLSPYLEHEELEKLEHQVVENITPTLNANRRVKTISQAHKQSLKIAKVKEGGLAFIIESSDRKSIEVMLRNLQNLIFGEALVSGLLVNLNTRIGACCVLEGDGHTVSASLLVHYALLAIQQNEDCGKQIYFYEDLKDFSVKERLSLARDLQTAIRTGQLQLYHQPQIDLSDKSVYGSEVLLRWEHPKHGFIPPDVFVAVAEDTGLINELTQWVIDGAFRQHQLLQRDRSAPYKMSINISGKDVSLPGFLGYVCERMTALDIPRSSIVFELTESVMVSDYDRLRRLMDDLSQLGISVSIDDYGTGYSSLSYISQLKFDELKIDKAFILDLDKSVRNLTIVKTTIEMAKSLNLKVIGEGVESAAIERKLKACGCDIGQGYYYSKPLSFDEYVTWMEQYRLKLCAVFDTAEL